jgi:hypothetical protein
MGVPCNVNIGQSGLIASLYYTVFSDASFATTVTSRTQANSSPSNFSELSISGTPSGVYGGVAVGASYGNCVVFDAIGQGIVSAVPLVNPNPSGGGVTVSGYATGQDPATLVLGAEASSWVGSNTIGQLINESSSPSIIAAAVVAALSSVAQIPPFPPTANGLVWLMTNPLIASSPRADFIIDQGFLAPLLIGYVALIGIGQTLSAATFRMWSPGSVDNSINASMSLNTVDGVTTATYAWQSGDTSVPGPFYGQVIPTVSGQQIATKPFRIWIEPTTV